VPKTHWCADIAAIAVIARHRRHRLDYGDVNGMFWLHRKSAFTSSLQSARPFVLVTRGGYFLDYAEHNGFGRTMMPAQRLLSDLGDDGDDARSRRFFLTPFA